jgi:hypothetical protein
VYYSDDRIITMYACDARTRGIHVVLSAEDAGISSRKFSFIENHSIFMISQFISVDTVSLVLR